MSRQTPAWPDGAKDHDDTTAACSSLDSLAANQSHYTYSTAIATCPEHPMTTEQSQLIINTVAIADPILACMAAHSLLPHWPRDA